MKRLSMYVDKNIEEEAARFELTDFGLLTTFYTADEVGKIEVDGEMDRAEMAALLAFLTEALR